MQSANPPGLNAQYIDIQLVHTKEIEQTEVMQFVIQEKTFAKTTR